MEIIRNCSHYSSIQTAVDLDRNAVPVRVVKTAFTEDGARAIRKEHEGILWYERRLNSAPGAVISLVNYKHTFSRLELAYRNGRPGDLTLSLAKNYKKIYNALNHSIEVFRKEDSPYNHGDYSIDNILFNEDDVVWILDWENFNDKLPREFDIVYFCYKRKNMLMANDVDAAINLLKYGIGRLNMPYDQIVRKPASYMRKLFLDNKSIFNSQIMKYPLVNCPYEDILALDAIFNKRVA